MPKKNILPVIIALIILFLSLTDSGSFSKLNLPLFAHADKVVHLLMYSGLMLSLIYANQVFLLRLRNFFLLSMIPFIFGIIIELLQNFFTGSRSGEFLDAIFNLIGILLAIPAWFLLKKIFASLLK